MTEPVLLIERRDAVVMLVLNRPHRLNAMTKTMAREVTNELERVAADPSVRAVIITGAGRGFCAGGDLEDIAGIAATIDVEAEAAELRLLQRSSLLLHEMPQPTLAAVNGPAAGAGLSWACAADLRIASESAVFRTSFVSAGLSGDFGGTWSLPRIVGPAKARELYLLNDKVRAPEALALGLVSRVVPDAELRTDAWSIGAQLAGAAPLSITRIKQNLNEGDTGRLEAALDREALRQAATSASADCAEAAAAFLEKREPHFLGR